MRYILIDCTMIDNINVMQLLTDKQLSHIKGYIVTTNLQIMGRFSLSFSLIKLNKRNIMKINFRISNYYNAWHSDAMKREI